MQQKLSVELKEGIQNISILRLNKYDILQHVVILDVDVVQGKALEKELNDKHGKNKAKFIECDITTQLQNAFDIAYKEYGYIDVVINNAGIMNDGPRVYEKEIAVNVVSTQSRSQQKWRNTEMLIIFVCT